MLVVPRKDALPAPGSVCYTTPCRVGGMEPAIACLPSFLYLRGHPRLCTQRCTRSGDAAALRRHSLTHWHPAATCRMRQEHQACFPYQQLVQASAAVRHPAATFTLSLRREPPSCWLARAVPRKCAGMAALRHPAATCNVRREPNLADHTEKACKAPNRNMRSEEEETRVMQATSRRGCRRRLQRHPTATCSTRQRIQSREPCQGSMHTSLDHAATQKRCKYRSLRHLVAHTTCNQHSIIHTVPERMQAC
jgi:hypothetical protein